MKLFYVFSIFTIFGRLESLLKNIENLNTRVSLTNEKKGIFSVKTDSEIAILSNEEQKEVVDYFIREYEKHIYVVLKLNKSTTGHLSELYEINMATKGVRLVLKTKFNEIDNLWISKNHFIFSLKSTKSLFLREINSKITHQFEFPHQIRDVSFDERENILATSLLLNIYKLNINQNSIETVTKAMGIHWHPVLKSWWLMTNDNNKIQLLYSSLIPYKPITFCNDVVISSLSEDFSWCLCRVDGSVKLLFMEKDLKKKVAIFPDHVSIKTISSLHAQHGEIIAVVHENIDGKEVVNLWRGSLEDMEISKISVDLHPTGDKLNDNFKFLLIEEFDGLLFLSVENLNHRENKYTSAISFNYGGSFHHLKLNEKIKGEECEWPDCWITVLYKQETFTGIFIKHKCQYPLIVISEGMITKGPKVIYRGLLISDDSGYSWRRVPENIVDIEIIAAGDVLVGIDKQNSMLLYSTDHGVNWETLTDVKHEISIHHIFVSTTAKYSLTFGTLYRDYSNNHLIFSYIDFKKLLKRDCTKDDLKLFAPGPTERAKCFKGSKSESYQKVSMSPCIRKESLFVTIKKANCTCTTDDYQCALGYHMLNGRCYEAIKEHEIRRHKNCYSAEFVPKVQTAKLQGPNDPCKDKIGFERDQRELCDVTFRETSLFLSVNKDLNVMLPQPIRKYHASPLPVGLRSLTDIWNFRFDTQSRRLYILTKSGISWMYYGSTKSIQHLIHVNAVRSNSIIGLIHDPYMLYLYYYSKDSIFVLDTSTNLKKTIYTTKKCTIYDVDFDSSYRQLLVSCYTISSAKKLTQLMILKLTGEETYRESSPKTLITFKKLRNTTAYFYDGETRILSLTGQNKVEVVKNHVQVKSAKFIEDDLFVVTKHGIFSNKYFCLLKNIDSAHIVMKPDASVNSFILELQQGCRFSTCDQFCFSISEIQFVCGCQDGMEYNKEKGKCVCANNQAKCQRCQSHEFLCNNNVCIDKILRCNGIDDCGDYSDEKCPFTCHSDQYHCPTEKRCIKLSQICDGKSDCHDKSDEKNCDKFVRKCSDNQFECDNKKCIGLEQVCDGRNDCGDHSDEINCDSLSCKANEAQCDDGTCIPSENICDGKFHCKDFSDERACVIRYFDHKFNDLSCFMSCDDTCQHVEKMCDHFTDCKDGTDEDMCGHKGYCSVKNSIVCSENNMCLIASQQCDGFNDCSDFSDELTCKKTPPKCLDDKFFNCEDKKKKICYTQVCDSKYDCDDQSDEIQECFDYFSENKIHIQSLRGGVAIIKWPPKGAPNKPLDITIKSFPDNTKIFQQQAFKGSQIEASGHQSCSRYILQIFDPDDDEVKHEHYTYKEPGMKAPKNLHFPNGQSKILWESEIPKCSSKAYYIECFDGKNLVLKDFAPEESYSFSPFRITRCRISACPSTTFNISCSPFTELTIRVGPSILSIVLIVLAVILLVILLIVCLKLSTKKQRLQKFFKRCWGACLSGNGLSSRSQSINFKREASFD